MARGYRSSPYPAEEFIQKWKAAGKKLVFSSDCHEKNQLMYGYSDCFRWL
jgi:histidinol phosphatase-like PHP family hydrolase